VALAGADSAAWGATRAAAGATFSVGLVLFTLGGAELFIGNKLVVMAWANSRGWTLAVLRNRAIVYVGNFAGALAVASAVRTAGTHEADRGAFAATALGSPTPR
jgi:formate transporter